MLPRHASYDQKYEYEMQIMVIEGIYLIQNYSNYNQNIECHRRNYQSQKEHFYCLSFKSQFNTYLKQFTHFYWKSPVLFDQIPTQRSNQSKVEEQGIQICTFKSKLLICFLNGTTPASFSFISNTHQKFYYKQICEKCPSSIQCWDSNS